jgi:2,3-diphosphopglycerate-independent phosphoglycerate mutase
MRFTFTVEKEKGPKILFLLIDGLGDVPCEEMQNRTALQAARLPTFDWLATKGLTGLMSPVEPGIACGSDTAHLSILGYDPRIYYKGRGAFETIGAGLPMAPGDIAFKVHTSSILWCLTAVV